MDLCGIMWHSVITANYRASAPPKEKLSLPSEHLSEAARHREWWEQAGKVSQPDRLHHNAWHLWVRVNLIYVKQIRKHVEDSSTAGTAAVNVMEGEILNGRVTWLAVY